MAGMNPYASYGSTGGTTVPGTGAAPAGMSGGMMAGLGAGAFLGGQLLNYLGESQGAKSMQREAEYQAEIQREIARQKHQAVIAALAQYDPNAQGVLAGVQAQQGMNAAAPALAAGGAALGLQGGQIAPVGAGLLTGQRLAGQKAAAGIQGQRTGQNLQRLATTERGLNESGQMAGQLGESAISNAGNNGAALRLAGSTLGGVGMPMMVMGMNQAAPAAPAPSTTTPVATIPGTNLPATPAGYTWRNGQLVAIPSARPSIPFESV